MKERRWGRAIAGLCILATISVGVATSGAAGAASDAAGGTASDTSGTQFSKLKPIKAPNPCKNDPGVSDSEIKIGSVIPTSGPASVSFSPKAARVLSTTW